MLLKGKIPSDWTGAADGYPAFGTGFADDDYIELIVAEDTVYSRDHVHKA